MSYAQQGEGPAIHTTKDDNGRVWEEAAPSRPGSFIFLILKLVSFKKLNGARMIKFPNLSYLYLIFSFIFYIFFFIFIILKLIYFIKNKNTMNFYKLFIKKHLNYYYYYLY